MPPLVRLLTRVYYYVVVKFDRILVACVGPFYIMKGVFVV